MPCTARMAQLSSYDLAPVAWFRFLKVLPTVPVPVSVPGRAVPTVLVSGSG